MTKTTNGIIAVIIAVAVAVAFTVSGVCYFNSKNKNATQNDAITNSNLTATNAVFVNELFQADGKINTANYAQLVNYLGGDLSQKDYSDAEVLSITVKHSFSKGEDSNGDNAGNYRRYYDSTSGTYKTIVVTICGLKWILTWLTSADSGDNSVGMVDADHDGNADMLACMWLSSSTQDAWSGKSLTSELYTDASLSSGSFKSKWNLWKDKSAENTSRAYPCDMYGSSYIRAVTLNNGGGYATGTDDGNSYCDPDLTARQKDINNPFARFTMTDEELVEAGGTVTGSITKYLVQPKYNAFMREGRAYTTLYWNTDPANESLIGATGLYSTDNGISKNYTAKPAYSAWADDYIWLPSISDTGYSDLADSSQHTKEAYWGCNDIERGNDSVKTWLRSARDKKTNEVQYVDTGGANLSSGAPQVVSAGVTSSYGVRPAFLLNLSLLNKGNGADITAQSSSATAGSVTAADYREVIDTGVYEYVYGNTGTLTATANSGYNFAYWLKDGAFFSGNTANPLSITADANATYIAVFYSEDLMFGLEDLQGTVAVMLETQGSNITTIAGSVDILGYTKFNGLDSVNIAATPAEGFEFVGWKINGSKTLSSTYTDDDVNIALTDLVDIKLIVAVFRPITT